MESDYETKRSDQDNQFMGAAMAVCQIIIAKAKSGEIDKDHSVAAGIVENLMWLVETGELPESNLPASQAWKRTFSDAPKTMLPRYALQLTPHELETRQKEVKAQARQWLDPDHLAALLLDRSHDDLANATGALLNAAHECRLFQIKVEGLSFDKLDTATATDARKAFEMLIEYFGADCICELAKGYEETDSAA